MAKLWRLNLLYKPAELLAAINAVEECLSYLNINKINAANLVIDLRKKGYRLVKVDDGKD